MGSLYDVADIGYDALNRLLTETVSNPNTPTVVLSSGYGSRPDGLRTSFSATVGATADFQNGYAYDALGQMTDVTQSGVLGGNTVADKHVHFDYDDLGRIEYVHRYASTGATNLVASSHYARDDAGRLTDLVHYQDIEDPLAAYSWTYDAADRLTQFVDGNDGTKNYTYDDTGRLTLVTDANQQTLETYEYDANGNRDTANGETYSTGDDNRLAFDGTYTYAYDPEGNRTAKFVDTDTDGVLDAGDTDVTQYTWDQRNRLTEVVHREAFGGTVDWKADYVYDAFNRRIGSLYDANGDGTADRVERYVWDGRSVALDFVDPDGGTGGGSSAPLSLSARYLWGPAVDQLLAQENVLTGGATSVKWPLPDQLGSTRDLVSSAGQIVSHYTYDSFGNATATRGDLSDTRFLFTCQEYDVLTATYYYDARWYDPKVAKFISLDPIGLLGGPNAYAYCGDAPTTYTDPSGLCRDRGSGFGVSDLV